MMKILGIESSSLVASVAVTDNGVTIAEYTVNFKKTHSQTLLPMLDEVVQMIGLDLKEIDAIAVSGGPGSFTGLRIGSATAKGLGLALDKPLIHIPTIDAMAFNLYGTSALICPMMDARRNQVYTGLYHFEKELETVLEPCCIEVGELIQKINELGERVIFLGDGTPVCEKQLRGELTVPFDFAPAHVNRQRAASVAALGEIYFAQGRTETAEEHMPDYLRKAQAERELEEAMKQGRVSDLAAGHSVKGAAQ
jgi:tRNA threonylcarbamoyladenosine biosynthesis protein TsaB